MAAGVRPVVSSYLSRASLPLGGTVTLSGGVTPQHPGQLVYLQRYSGGRRSNIVSGRLSSRSIYAFTIKPTARGGHTYRVARPADTDHLVAVSPTRSFTVSRASAAATGKFGPNACGRTDLSTSQERRQPNCLTLS